MLVETLQYFPCIQIRFIFVLAVVPIDVHLNAIEHPSDGCI